MNPTSAAPGPEASMIIKSLTGFMLCKYINVASAAILAYDYILTFSDEAEFIWWKPWSSTTILFFFIRYQPFCDAPALLIHHFLNGAPAFVCAIFIKFQSWSFLLGVTLAEIVLVLRTTAIWGNRKSIAFFLLGLLAAISAPSIYFVQQYSQSVTFIPSPTPVIDGCFVSKAENVLFVFYIGLQVFETVVFLLTLLRARSYQHGTLYRSLYHDSVLFYAYLFVITLVNTVVFFLTTSPCRGGILTGLHRIVHAILSERIILNIRKASMKHHTSYLDDSQSLPSLIFGETSITGYPLDRAVLSITTTTTTVREDRTLDSLTMISPIRE